MPLKMSLTLVKVPSSKPLTAELEREILAALNRQAIHVKAAAVSTSPIATGQLRQSWQITPAIKAGNSYVATVGSDAPQADVQTGGARPHYPWPQTGMQTWVRRKLGIEDDEKVKSVAHLISAKIARRGLQQNSSLVQAIQRAATSTQVVLQASINKIIQRFNASS